MTAVFWISLLSILVQCAFPFAGVAVAYKLGGDGLDMALSAVFSSILGFFAVLAFIIWAIQFT